MLRVISLLAFMQNVTLGAATDFILSQFFVDENCSKPVRNNIAVLEVCKQVESGMWVHATVDKNGTYVAKYYTDNACSQAVAEDVKPPMVAPSDGCNNVGSFHMKLGGRYSAESYTVEYFDDAECKGNVMKEEVRAIDLCVPNAFGAYHARSFCHSGSAYQFAFGGNDCDTGGVAGQGESVPGCTPSNDQGPSIKSMKQKDGAACPARPEDKVTATMSDGSCAVSMFMMAQMPYGTGGDYAACKECWYGGCPYDVLCSDTCANHAKTVECLGRDVAALGPFKAAVLQQTGKCSNIPAKSTCGAWKTMFKGGKCCGMDAQNQDFALCSFLKNFYKEEGCCGNPSKTVSEFSFSKQVAT